jgi:glycosyltransferase involved in cell wall biosynthesis
LSKNFHSRLLKNLPFAAFLVQIPDAKRNRKHMKLLVFAHTPPPHHGQSYMVKLMLKGLGGDRREKRRSEPESNPFGVECYHVNARFSDSPENIGEFQGIKLLRLFLFCLEAVWCRFRHGVVNFYYVPAPGKRVALYRDWLVMLCCRPFFKNVILHWHAAGLAEWLETDGRTRTRAITRRLFKPVNLSIVLSRFNYADAEKLSSGRICIVDNGIPDPCPDFAASVQPRRRVRFAVRRKLLAGEKPDDREMVDCQGDPHLVNVLFLAQCSRDKGLFATMEGVVAANRQLAAQRSVVRMKLTIGGNFVTGAERAEFDRLMQSQEYAETIQYSGFVAGIEKKRLLTEADIFCFPTRYLGENQPLNLIEAMAFGLPIATTRWRSLPEMLPPDYPVFMDSPSPENVPTSLQKLMDWTSGETLREHFLARFAIEQHLENLARAIHSVETVTHDPP